MATDATIAVEVKPGEFIVNYVYSDGYPEGLGLQLYIYFDSLKAALKLCKTREIRWIDNGKLERYSRSVHRRVIPAKGYEAVDLREVFYTNYVYVFMKGQWYWCKAGSRSFTSLEWSVAHLVQQKLDI